MKTVLCLLTLLVALRGTEPKPLSESDHVDSDVGSDNNNYNRELHVRRRHPRQFRRGGGLLFKKDHLKDFRSQVIVPTSAPSPLPTTHVPTNAPTEEVIVPTSAPTSAPSPLQTTHVPTNAPTEDDLVCIRATFPPLGSSGTTIMGRMGNSFVPTDCERCIRFPNSLSCIYPGPSGVFERYYE